MAAYVAATALTSVVSTTGAFATSIDLAFSEADLHPPVKSHDGWLFGRVGELCKSWYDCDFYVRTRRSAVQQYLCAGPQGGGALEVVLQFSSSQSISV
jgi:hypothetical protein